ncbi:MAG: hypothetical protein ACN6RK_09045, partial [Stenotrophomonas sp.]
MKFLLAPALLLASSIGISLAAPAGFAHAAPLQIEAVSPLVVAAADAGPFVDDREKGKDALYAVGFFLVVFILIGWLATHLSREKKSAKVAPLPRVPVRMHWYDGTQLPIADWDRISEDAPTGLDADATHIHRTSAAKEWLEALNQQLGEHYRITESADFLLLSNLMDRPGEVFLATCQRLLS